MCTVLPKLWPQILQLTYNYSEGGHGKGIPDSLGGWAKGTADDAVKHGRDVASFEALVSLLKHSSKKVLIETIDLCEIEFYDKLVPPNLVPFPSTMMVHQFSWTKEFSDKIYFNSVSCYDCPPGSRCEHFSLPGSPWNFLPQPQDVSPEGANKRNGPRSGAPSDSETAAKKPRKTKPLSRIVETADWVAVPFGRFWYPGAKCKISSEKYSKKNTNRIY